MTLILPGAKSAPRYRRPSAVTPMQRLKLRLAVVILNLALWGLIIWGFRQCA